MTGTNPDFLLAQVEPDASAGAASALGPLAEICEQHGGIVLAHVPSDQIGALEPGSIAYTTLLVRFSDQAATEKTWAVAKSDGRLGPLLSDPKARVTAAQGLPVDGIPGDPLPTVASVDDFPVADGPRGYMFIDGVATDLDRLLIYRGIIFELMLERSAYYLVICDASGVRVLSGEWKQEIYAISYWPTPGHAEDFWYCDRYQNEGIPTRTGAGTFYVNLMSGKDLGA